MTKEEFLKVFTRTDKSDRLGTNENAIKIMADMLEAHEQCEDEDVRLIAENVGVIGKVAPTFTVFESQNSSMYMHNFKAYQLKVGCPLEVATHEFGHAVLNIATDTKVPDGFEEVVMNAQKHALLPENKDKFKEYVQYLAKNKDELTTAEKGPVGDIISSIFQQPGFRIGSFENVCMLPSFHTHDYYFDDEQKCMKLKPIFDENFANIYTLRTMGAMQELGKLKEIFGEEFFRVMDEQIKNVAQFFERQASIGEVQNGFETENVHSKIMGQIIGQRSSELVQVIEPREIGIDKNTKGEEKQ